MNLNHRNMKRAYGLFHNMPIFISFEQVGGGGGGGLVEEKPIDAAGKTATTTSYSGDIVNHYTYQGRKLGKKVYNSQHTLTVDEEYYDELMFSFGKPSRISHGDGYIALSDNGGATFYYYLKDHLGNVRSVILPDANNQPIVSQANDYFPFGMSFESSLPNPGIRANYNKLKYNGKEEQEMPGKWLDYGARFYDAQIGRWHSVDPHAENYLPISPYAYVGNNPIIRVDPDGRDWDLVIDHDKQTVTIKANFLTFAGNDVTVQSSADAWNAQSGKFNYVIGEGDNTMSYSINFDIRVNDGSDEAGALNDISVAPDDSKVFTDRERTVDGNEVKVGGLSNGASILMPESQKENVMRTSHEMGHNFAMGHSTGLMSLQGGKNLKSKSVKETLIHSGVIETNKNSHNPNAKLRNKTVIGNVPDNFNKGKIKTNENWKKKDFN